MPRTTGPLAWLSETAAARAEQAVKPLVDAAMQTRDQLVQGAQQPPVPSFSAQIPSLEALMGGASGATNQPASQQSPAQQPASFMAGIPTLASLGLQQHQPVQTPSGTPAAMPQAPGLVNATITQGPKPGQTLQPGESVGSINFGPPVGPPSDGVLRWSSDVDEASRQYGVPREIILGIMDIESGGNPEAVSAAGAMGLMQVMPFHYAQGENGMDPRTSILRGTKILADNYRRWGDWDRAAAAYFGAIDDKGNITDATDVTGTSGSKYVQLFRGAASKYSAPAQPKPAPQSSAAPPAQVTQAQPVQQRAPDGFTWSTDNPNSAQYARPGAPKFRVRDPYGNEYELTQEQIDKTPGGSRHLTILGPVAMNAGAAAGPPQPAPAAASAPPSGGTSTPDGVTGISPLGVDPGRPSAAPSRANPDFQTQPDGGAPGEFQPLQYRAPLGPADDMPQGGGVERDPRRFIPSRNIEPLGPALRGQDVLDNEQYGSARGQAVDPNDPVLPHIVADPARPYTAPGTRNRAVPGSVIEYTDPQEPQPYGPFDPAERNRAVPGDTVEWSESPPPAGGRYPNIIRDEQRTPDVLYDEFGNPYTQTRQGAYQAATGRSGGAGVMLRGPLSSAPQEVGNDEPYDPRQYDEGPREAAPTSTYNDPTTTGTISEPIPQPQYDYQIADGRTEPPTPQGDYRPMRTIPNPQRPAAADPATFLAEDSQSTPPPPMADYPLMPPGSPYGDQQAAMEPRPDRFEARPGYGQVVSSPGEPDYVDARPQTVTQAIVQGIREQQGPGGLLEPAGGMPRQVGRMNEIGRLAAAETGKPIGLLAVADPVWRAQNPELYAEYQDLQRQFDLGMVGNLDAPRRVAQGAAQLAAPIVREGTEAAGRGLRGYVDDAVEGAGRLWREGSETAARLNAEPGGVTAAGLGAVPESAPVSAPPFYSQLRRVIEEKMPNRSAPQQVQGILRSGQVKPDEIAWTGIDDFLRQQRGPVTKQQVLDFLDQNEVKVEEVVKGNTRPRADGSGVEFDPESGPTRYAGFQLPGGENYRELLLTLPSKSPDTLPEGFTVAPGVSRGGPRFEVTGPGFGRYASGDTEAEAISQFHRMHGERKPYQSSHWNEPNVLAHVRFSERTAPDGKRVLHIEEVQSDWHQSGRKQGYQGAAPRSVAEIQEDLNAAYARGDREAIDRLNAEAIGNERNTKAVPDAPFKKTWPELTVKRMMRWAAENDFDRIVWTPGAVQAKRFDLSKQISSVAYSGSNLKAWDKSGREVLSHTGVRVEDLPGYIGQELSEKLLAQPPRGTLRTLEGEDLRVGGEGMIGFYDKILPETINKMGRKFGTRVAESRIPVGKRTQRVLGIDITPQMRQSVMQEGQPLFASAGSTPTTRGSGALAATNRVLGEAIAGGTGGAVIEQARNPDEDPRTAAARGFAVGAAGFPLATRAIRGVAGAAARNIDPGLRGAMQAPNVRGAAGVADDLLPAPQSAAPAPRVSFEDFTRAADSPAQQAAREAASQPYIRPGDNQLLREQFGRPWEEVAPVYPGSANRLGEATQQIVTEGRRIRGPQEQVLPGERSMISPPRTIEPQSISLNAALGSLPNNPPRRPASPLPEGAQPIRASDAAEVARLRLDKFPEEVRDLIEAGAKEQDWARTQRRGVMPDDVVAARAADDAVSVDAIIKKGKAGKSYNAEETVAIRNAVASQSNTVRQLTDEIAEARTAGMTPDLLIARRAAEATRLNGLIQVAEGARAEAGRTLRAYRQQAKLIELDPNRAIEQIYRKLGGRENAAAAVDEYTKLVNDGANPIQMAKFWARVEAGEIKGADLFALYRRFNMLSGPRTIEVNGLSGAVNLSYEVLGQASNQMARGRLTEAAAEVAAPFKAMDRAFQNMAETIWHGVSNEQALRGDIPRTLSSRTGNQAARGALTVMEIPDRINAGVDQFFRTMTEDWAATILAHKQARAAGVKTSSKNWAETVAKNLEAIRDDPTKFPEIKEMADHVTFSETPGALGQALAHVQQVPYIGQALMPFLRTPYNIASRAVDISPLGVARTAFEATTGMGRGRQNISRRIRDNMIGVAGAVWAYNAAMNGNVTGAGPDDAEKRAQLRATGWQPYSIKIGDQYWSYANFAPFSLMLSMGAAAAEAQKYAKPEKTDTLSMLADAAGRSVNVVQDMTVLAGIGSVIKSIQDPDRYGAQWLTQFLQTLIPAGSALNTIGQATDPNIRRAERDTFSNQVVGGLKSRIPGVRETVPAAQDPLGRAVPNEQTGMGALNPFRPTRERPDPTLQAFIDAGVDIGKPRENLTLRPGAPPIPLTPAEQRRWNELRGEQLQQVAPQVAQATSYQQAGRPSKELVLKRLLNNAGNAADAKLLGEIGEAEIRRRLTEAAKKKAG